ncbi:hypothetical protein RF11_13432 [Thelohanellus kitauei]|uniref:Uncharacterized protein n=1 Tax=Thelohanellus kitauei TaxID=669202 RepID=A0A0C2MDH3_THEKT|nr:hypothetical protein RF11_13432 [Thelohanellus kitauei]
MKEFSVTTFRRFESERCNKFEEAGDAYFKGAELLNAHPDDQWDIFFDYARSAKCFIKIKSKRANTCFHKAISALVKDRSYNTAIEYSYRYGYQIEKELCDTNLSDKLYKRADTLSRKHHKPHTCVMTTFDLAKYEKDIGKAKDDHQKFYIEIIGGKPVESNFPRNLMVLAVGLCRSCVETFEKLEEIIKVSQKLQANK